MKIFLLVLVLGLTGHCLNAQSIIFIYDQSGNRIERKLPDGTSRVLEKDSASVVSSYDSLLNESPTVYPNATNGQFIVRLTDPEDFGQIFIFDLQGRLVFQDELSGSLEVDISHRPAGVYVIKCRTSRELITQKIIKK